MSILVLPNDDECVEKYNHGDSCRRIQSGFSQKNVTRVKEVSVSITKILPYERYVFVYNLHF